MTDELEGRELQQKAVGLLAAQESERRVETYDLTLKLAAMDYAVFPKQETKEALFLAAQRFSKAYVECLEKLDSDED